MKRQAHCERCDHVFSGWALALEAVALVAWLWLLFVVLPVVVR